VSLFKRKTYPCHRGR